MKRALERSDEYIDELENRVRVSEKRYLEVQEGCGTCKTVKETLSQQQKVNMMMRSLSDNERKSICSNPEAECGTFSRNHSLIFMPSTVHEEFDKNVTAKQKNEDSESTSSDLLPSTPSSAFRSLTLRSPGIREKKVAFKPGSYLRKLDFEEVPSPDKSSTTLENQFSGFEKFPTGFPPSDVEPSKSVLWAGWDKSNSDDQPCPGSSKESSINGSTNLVADEPDSFQMSSEASMDAAYLNKISELDSMMLEGESSCSPGLSADSSLPTDVDKALVPEAQMCPDASSSHSGKLVIHNKHNNPQPCDSMEVIFKEKDAPKSSAEEGFAALVLGRKNVQVPNCTRHGGASHTEELSFDLLFDPLDENKAGPSGFPASQDHDHVNPSSSSSGCTAGKPVNTIRDRHSLNSSQPIKRKSHSPFTISSPTKLSKLM